MRCTYIHTRGYNRFDTTLIRELIIRPENPIQLLLGSNGSGKSSLMALLYPTVPEKADFDKEGYYEYRCEHRGKNYRLVSKLDRGFKHEFYIDDSDNLNTGGTQPAQWILIQEHLELTDDIIRLLLGVETQYRFTEMPPMKRRERLTQICPVNVDYALQLFQVVKQQVRNLKAVNEHTASQLVEAYTQYEGNAQDDWTVFEEELDQQRKALEKMMGLPLFDSDTDERVLLGAYRQSADFIKTLIVKIANYQGGSSEDEQCNLHALQQELLKANTRLESQIDELLEIDKILEQLNQTEDGDADQIKARVVQLEHQLNENKTSFDMRDSDIDAVQASRQLSGIRDALPALIMNWVDKDNSCTLQDAQSVNNELEALERKVRVARDAVANFESHLEHLEHQPEAHCPKCQFRFHVGETEKTSKAGIELRIQNGKKWLLEQEAILDELRAKAERYRRWIDEDRRLKQMRENTPACEPMWVALFEHGRTNGFGYSAMGIINHWFHQFDQLRLYRETNDELQRLKSLLERFNSVDIEPLQQRREKLYESRRELLATVEWLTREIASTQTRLDIITEIAEEQTRAEAADKYLQTLWIEYMQYLYTTSLRNAMADTVRSISAAEQRLQKARSDKHHLEALEKTKAEVEERLTYAQLVLDELNPSNGLIAETIAGPINAFIDYMNGIIASIWEYPLQILPCAVDAQGLNYRFPLLSEKYPTPRKDIVYGSNGQKEMIDKAFIIAMMHYKGYTDYPLMLDEFASTFDPQHQSNAMDFIRQLVDSSRCSQVWFISHYVINHASFSKAECTVLDKTNIILPEKYNGHVTLR